MLQKIGFLPGFNKQVTPTGAEAQWQEGENIRFRYGTPEKIGGWQQLGESKLTGAARQMHHIVNKDSQKFSIIGTNRILYAYTGGVFYDIHPLVNPSGTAITSAFTTTNNQKIVTITANSHGFVAGDICLFGDASTFSAITNSNYTSATFCDKKFMVTEVVDTNNFKITVENNETGSGAATSGGITYFRYYHVGPAEQVGAYGFGISLYGGKVLGSTTTTLTAPGLNDDANGTGGSGTTINVGSTTGFPSSGTNYFQVGSEEISYTGVTATSFTGITRAVRGSTRAAHSGGATITNTSSWTGMGDLQHLTLTKLLTQDCGPLII